MEQSVLRRAEADTGLAVELAGQYEELMVQFTQLQALYNEQSALLEKLQQQAPMDEVTGLANMVSLEAELERSIATARRHGRLHALLVFQIVDFDAMAALGDAVVAGILTHMARLLRQNIRPTDIAARLRAGTFAVLLNEVRAEGHAHQRAKAITDVVDQTPCVVAERSFQLSATSGVQTFGAEADAGTLIAEAQNAMAQRGPVIAAH